MPVVVAVVVLVNVLGGDVADDDGSQGPADVEATIGTALSKQLFTDDYADVFAGDERWQSLPTPEGNTFDWDPESTYVRKPPYFDGMQMETTPVTDIEGARVLAKLGDAAATSLGRRGKGAGGPRRRGLPRNACDGPARVGLRGRQARDALRLAGRPVEVLNCLGKNTLRPRGVPGGKRS